MPSGTPVFSADFTDVIGAAVNSQHSARIVVTGFTGTYQASITGNTAQLSTDNLTWSTQAFVAAGATIFVRQTAGVANETRTAVLSVSGTSADWVVTTVPAVRTYSTAGTFSETRVPVGRFLRVECWGGGGAGGGGGGRGIIGGGGGGGGYSMLQIPRANLAAAETVTIGAGGAATGAGQNATGGAGAASSFGMHLTAGGGGGGLAASLGSGGGAGGTGVTNAGTPGTSGALTALAGAGGKGGGALGGAGGAGGSGAGTAPGGGGGGSIGDGGGGAFGNGAPPSGPGGAGRCVTTIIP